MTAAAPCGGATRAMQAEDAASKAALGQHYVAAYVAVDVLGDAQVIGVRAEHVGLVAGERGAPADMVDHLADGLPGGRIEVRIKTDADQVHRALCERMRVAEVSAHRQAEGPGERSFERSGRTSFEWPTALLWSRRGCRRGVTGPLPARQQQRSYFTCDGSTGIYPCYAQSMLLRRASRCRPQGDGAVRRGAGAGRPHSGAVSAAAPRRARWRFAVLDRARARGRARSFDHRAQRQAAATARPGACRARRRSARGDGGAGGGRPPCAAQSDAALGRGATPDRGGARPGRGRTAALAATNLVTG